jgi:uncharacterized membrane protein (DUF106 family)
MFSFYTNTLLPLLNAVFIAFDWIFGWSLLFGAFTALIIAGLLTGLFVNLIQKYCSNQNILGRSKADLEKIKSLRASAKSSGDSDAIARLNTLAGRISGRYAWGSFKPALWSIPPLCVLAMWTGSRMSFEPVRPGNDVAVIAHFEDGASGFAHMVPSSDLKSAGPAISAIAVPLDLAPGQESGPQARWTVKADKSGEFPLQIRYQDQTFSIPLPVAEKGGRPPEAATTFAIETPNRDGLRVVEFKLNHTVDPAWWNFYQQWMGLYLIAAMISGLALRRVLGVN